MLAAAVEEFAVRGLAGTGTQAIADRAGISQPYLFRLFPTKKALFCEAVTHVYASVVDTFTEVAGEHTGREALAAMGQAYDALIADRTFLLMQLQAYASCHDDDVRAVTRRGFRDVWRAAERLSGLDAEQVRDFYAHGMFCNIVAAMELDVVDEPWAQRAFHAQPHPGEEPITPPTTT